MTTYRQINVSDYWNPNEIHASRLSDTYWIIEAKLESGRVARLFKTMSTPTEQDEPDLLKQLIVQDRKARVKEWFERVWQMLTRCHFCRCELFLLAIVVALPPGPPVHHPVSGHIIFQRQAPKGGFGMLTYGVDNPVSVRADV